MGESRQYKFSWDLLGDLSIGRPNLGNTTRVEVYRLMQYTFRDILEATYGTEETDRLFYDAGHMAGTEFFKYYLHKINNIKDLIKELQSLFNELGIGILRIEKLDMDKGEIVLTVSEDLDCSGLPENGIEICIYDEGFISGLLEAFTGKAFKVKEIDCWCTGDRTCRFKANVEH